MHSQHLREVGTLLNGKPSNAGNSYQCHCPAHDDKNPSLTVSHSDQGFILFKCHAGCSFQAIRQSLKEKYGWEYPSANNNQEEQTKTTYDYVDEDNKLLFQVVRSYPKKFTQRQPDGSGNWVWNIKGVRKVLYNLPGILKAKDSNESIYIVEGEKDANNLIKLNLAATCCSGGAGKWSDSYNQHLKGADVVILPDNDNPGKDHAVQILKSLARIAKSIKLVELPNLKEKEDVSDWLSKGNTKDNLLQIVSKAPITKNLKETTESKIVVVNIKDFLAKELPPREEILSPWLCSQSLNMIYAWRGVGKTHVSLGIAHAVASASSYLNWQARIARKVIYIDGEMPGCALQARLAGIIQSHDNEFDENNFKIITPDLQGHGMPDLSTIDGQAIINDIIEEDTSLIIIDNLSCLARTGKENEADSWLPVQTWALTLRQRGISVLFVHHASKNGAQRGTSKKEDLLDCVISLKRPAQYLPQDGAVFEVHFDKARHLQGQDTEPFEARLVTENSGKMTWTVSSVSNSTFDQVVELANSGYKQAAIARELEVNKSTVSRHFKDAIERGLILTSRAL